MFNNFKRKIQEGFTLVEILIVVVIIGILASIAIPTYFKYVERGYASDARVTIKNVVENSKLFYAERDDWPENVEDLNNSGYGNVPRATTDKWDFDIALDYDDDAGITGTIIATSLDPMPGGSGKILTYDAETGLYTGYGVSASAEEE